jgi:N-sulfoglucosamine sulfohydrolase
MVGGFAGFAVAQTQPAPPEPQRGEGGRPNILWISNEDMSPRLGAYGDSLARTPTLDMLAKQSVRYTNAFTTAPVCAPSRAAIITGMHQNAIGAQHMRTTENRVPELPGPYLAVPPFYVKAFPEYLRAAGYFTSNRSKTDYQFGEPFTIWDDLGPNAHWRNRPDKSQPFFSVFNITVTHESQIFPTSPARKGKPLATDRARVQVPPYYPDTPLVREELARVYDNIADMDRQAGAILRQLEEDGLAQSTVVFYWSDHGDGVPRAKRSLYDSGLHVPLMIRWPEGLRRAGLPPSREAPAGRRSLGEGGPVRPSVSDELVSFVDLAPTVLALAGVDIPGHMQGRALAGEQAGPEPEYVFAARDRMDIEYDMMRSARDARFLYIRNFEPELPFAGHIIYRNQSNIMQEWFRLQAAGKLKGPAALWMRTSRPAEELYDTQADPHQIHDLTADLAHRATLERMRRAVADWMTRIGDQGLINEAEMIQRMWPGGVQPETAQPYIVPRRTTDAPARLQTMTFKDPMEVVIYVPTQGASIGYTTEEGPNPKWRLYTGPILVDRPMSIRAKAIRYGYKESQETRTTFTRERQALARSLDPPSSVRSSAPPRNTISSRVSATFSACRPPASR